MRIFVACSLIFSAINSLLMANIRLDNILSIFLTTYKAHVFYFRRYWGSAYIFTELLNTLNLLISHRWQIFMS